MLCNILPELVCLYFHAATCEANSVYSYSSPCILDAGANNKPVVGYIHICPEVRFI